MISKIPRLVLAALLFAFAAPLAGCEYEEAEVPVAGYGYEPSYYNGYVVYYDAGGLPYYYVDGSMYYVPRSYVYYDSLCDHYRVYRPYYQRWYVSGGYRYQRYHVATAGHVVAPSGGVTRVYRPAAPSPHHGGMRSVPRHHSGGGGHVRAGGGRGRRH